ncbi:MAG: TetR/AcrR family transcriptional regulator [Bdellovibrionales bacterium]
MSSEDLKALIVRIARKHFATHGYYGASLKAIAEEAKVANSLINYHFSDRQGLFRSCIVPFLHNRMESIQRILREPHSREDLRVRLELFVEEMLDAIRVDPHGFDILNREIKAGNVEILEVFEETVLEAFRLAVVFFEQAKANGLLRPEMDPQIMSLLLVSATCDAPRKEMIMKRLFNRSLEEADFRKSLVQHVVVFFLSGVTG